MGREGSVAPAGEMRATLAATPAAPARARRELTRWCEEAGLERALVRDLRLAVTELVTNAVRHAELGPEDEVELAVDCGEDRIRLEVRDGGAGFDEFLPIPSEEAPSGRGLYVVHRLATSWGLDPGPPFSVWLELERP